MEELGKVKRVQKRDGQLVLFDENRITDSIFKAVKAVGQEDYQKAKGLSTKVASILEIFFKGGVIPTIEMIQDLIEKVLIESSEVEIAKAFILYRDQRRRIRDEGQAVLNVTATMDGYLKQSDWRVAENANMNYSMSGLLMQYTLMRSLKRTEAQTSTYTTLAWESQATAQDGHCGSCLQRASMGFRAKSIRNHQSILILPCGR
jgi:ribonucleoside-triphosphate reductase